MNAASNKLLFADDPTFVPPDNVSECEHRGYEYYKVGDEWRRKVKIRIWCDICNAKKQCFHEVWELDSKRTISKETLQAYEDAIFSINTKQGVISFKVGTIYKDILSFMKNESLKSAALITAYNPYSEILTKEQNELAQTQLIQELKNLGVDFIYGDGRDAEGIWDPEPSLFAMNIALEDAEKLAAKFGQNAFVWVEAITGIPTLKLIFPIAP